MTNTETIMSLEEARPIFQDIPQVVRELSEYGIVLNDSPTGSGKSVLVDHLLLSELVHEKWDLVIYLSYSWDIIRERKLVKDPGLGPVEVAVVEGRPKDRCADLDPEWERLEASGAISFGKNTLCTTCPNNTEEKPCTWVQSFFDRVGDARIVFVAEQVLQKNPWLFLYLSKGKRVLVIADEALFTTASFAKRITRKQLTMFQRAIERVSEIEPDLKRSWLQAIDRLTTVKKKGLTNLKVKLPPKLHEYGASIQQAGLQLFSWKFRYLAYDLESFQRSRFTERWLTDSDDISFLDRPYLNFDMLFLSAHLTPRFIEHRLGLREGKIHRMLPHVKVSLDPGTKVYNLTSSSGSKWALKDKLRGKNSFDHLAKLFTSMIVRNIKRGKSTLLVTSKVLKGRFADRLEDLLSKLDQDVTFITENYDECQLGKPDPLVIPIIHYGLSGINLFNDYETCICMSSYYMSDIEIFKLLYDGRPDEKVPKFVRETINGYRAWPDKDELLGCRRMLDEYVDCYEKGAVRQVVGRVRPYTYPREIFLFQRQDFSEYFGDAYTEIEEATDVYKVLGMKHFRDLAKEIELERFNNLIQEGLAKGEASRVLGMSPQRGSQLLRWARENIKGEMVQDA